MMDDLQTHTQAPATITITAAAPAPATTPSPPPLTSRKATHAIRKAPLPPQPKRRPIIIRTISSPEIIHTQPSDFMWMVQSLTGSIETRSHCLKHKPPHLNSTQQQTTSHGVASSPDQQATASLCPSSPQTSTFAYETLSDFSPRGPLPDPAASFDTILTSIPPAPVFDFSPDNYPPQSLQSPQKSSLNSFCNSRFNPVYNSCLQSNYPKRTAQTASQRVINPAKPQQAHVPFTTNPAPNQLKAGISASNWPISCCSDYSNYTENNDDSNTDDVWTFDALLSPESHDKGNSHCVQAGFISPCVLLQTPLETILLKDFDEDL